MRHITRLFQVAVLFFLPSPALFAQSAVDPSGHWKGTVQIPGQELAFEVDLMKNAKGLLSGTLNNPADNVRGLPLRTVVVEGTSISFQARKDQPFSGTLSTDGKAVFGEYTLAGYTLPFSMNRTGAAEIIVPERSAPIARRLEGRWSGALNVGGKTMRLNLSMANLPDGTATASLVSLDEGELELPITVAQDASTVTITISMTGAAYSGVLNADGTELAGTFTQREFAAPLTFKAVRP